MAKVGEKKWIDAARVILECPVTQAVAEGLVMDVVSYLDVAKRKGNSVWGHYRSTHWPTPFVTPPLDIDAGGSIREARGVVIFTIDCRSQDHARKLIAGLWDSLSRDYTGSGVHLNLSAAIYAVERQDWLAS
jgi:hypothetical protein